MRKLIFVLIFFAATAFVAQSQTPSFPGAEGHGRYTTGGRGGKICYVTTLVDSNNSGSFRYAVNQKGPRIILFKISGTIVLDSALSIQNNDITIAGQSAPGDGICISGYPVTVNANNVIIRYMRFRLGDDKLTAQQAAGADGLGGRFYKDIMIDHCSISWSTDECASFYNNENLTLQWCLISESLCLSKHPKSAHGYGAIWGGMKASFHHNLLAHHLSRVPRLGPGAKSTKTNELVDVRNNVYYNYAGEGCYAGEAMHVNIVNNYYKLGPANDWEGEKKGRIISIDKKIDNMFPPINETWGTFFIAGNVIEGQDKATKDNWTFGVYNQFSPKYGVIDKATKDSIRLDAPLATNVVTTHSPQMAYEKVLDHAGCSLVRDALDKRVINETRNNSYTFIGSKSKMRGIIDSQNDLKPAGAGSNWSAWPLLASTPAPKDKNNDGIPDGWLEKNYKGKQATDKNSEGYTYLEVYLNSLVAAITKTQNEGGVQSPN